MVHICSFQEMKVSSFFLFFLHDIKAEVCIGEKKKRFSAKKVIYSPTFVEIGLLTTSQLRRNNPRVPDLRREAVRQGLRSPFLKGSSQTSLTFSTRKFTMLKALRLPHTLSSRRPTICCRASSYPQSEPRASASAAHGRRQADRKWDLGEEVHGSVLNGEKLCTWVREGRLC